MRLLGRAKALQIHIGERDTWQGKPLHEAIVARARELGIAGATVYRGLSGYGAHRKIHTHKAMGLAQDDPLTIEIIDIVERVEKLLVALDPMLAGGCLMTMSDVDVVRYTTPDEGGAPST